MEIARYITPYWVGTFQQLQRGLEFDVTDFKMLLKDSAELRIYIENWTAKADIVSIDFDYIVGTPDYENYAISEVLNLHSNSIQWYSVWRCSQSRFRKINSNSK